MTTPSEFRRRVYQEEAPPDELALDGEALVVTTPEAERGGVMLDLALVLAARSDAAGLRGPDADLRRANDLLCEAISYPLGRRDAVAVLVNRSVVLLRLFERDNDAQLLVEATNCLEAAREREGDYSTSSPAIHTMLGSVLLRRAEQGGEQRLLDDSVRWLDRAVRATDRTSPDWLGRNANLANALLQQAENGDLEALDRVVALADDLLASRERGSRGQKNALLVAARAYRLLALWSDAPEALDRAMDLGRAVVAAGVDDEAGTRAAGNLGNALVHKAMTVHDGRLLDEAVQVLTVARAGMRGRPADLALQTANLGRARLARFGVTNDFEDAQAAVELFSEVRSSRVLDPGLVGQVEANLGLAYLAMADATTEDAGLYEVALEHVLSGLGRLDPEDEPWLALEAAHGIGDRLVADGRFGLAADVLAVAAAALEVSVGISQTAAPARVLARTQGVAPLAAYAMALAGRPEDAVVVLERGRARGLRTTLGLDDDALDELRRAGYSPLADAHARIASSLARSVDEAASGGSTGRRRLLLDQLSEVRRDIRAIPAFADFAVAPDFEAIRDQAGGDPLVYGSVTAYGAVLLVVWAEGTVDVESLPALTDAAMHAPGSAYLTAAERFRRAVDPSAVLDAWLSAVDECASWLGDVVGQPLCSALARRSASGAVLLLPGLLGLLPVTAAVVDPTGARLSERVVTRLAPSAVGLRAAREMARASDVSRALVVGGPTSTTLPRLEAAEAEATLVGTTFRHSTTLTGSAATKAGVVAALPNHGVAHLACHALPDVADPLAGRLMLADDEALTLREIMGLRLWRMRLCFLSACETGIVGVDIPDEVVSLPVGLIQAGAAGVVASMWPVRDTTAAVLAAAFYRRWPTQHSDPAVALRDAQSWLRRATTTQVDELLAGMLPDKERAELVAANGTAPAERAFPYVVDWAAFTYVGA